MTDKRRIIVSDALTYANGALHLGHVLGAIQVDIWARFQKMCAHECYFIGGSDAHGTPIMLRAEADHISPEALVKQVAQSQRDDYHAFFIEFDAYASTHAQQNKTFLYDIYSKLKEKGDIESKEIKQAYDEDKQMFLPDRFVKGTCPKCHAEAQYGDSCEVCGATYETTDLIDPISVVSGKPPVEKTTTHYFFKLSNYQSLLKDWTNAGHVQASVAKKLNDWFEQGLQSWDISRDQPYFGFEMPDHEGKYFYVWLDAPIGYLTAFYQLCQQEGLDFNTFWHKQSTTELYHFIGKDITYFHALFWPAILEAADYRLPTGVYTHGFLTVNGQKMSKSRGTFILARDYLNHLDPEHLRYYIAAKLGDGTMDIDLNFDDFTARVNADLVGKVVNIASRCAGFIVKRFDGQFSDTLMDDTLFGEAQAMATGIAEHYEARRYNKAIREIMQLADKANQFIDHHKPWVLAKEAGREHEVQLICSQGLNLFRLLMIYLKPILPAMAIKVEAFLNIAPLMWDDAQQSLLAHRINVFKPLTLRVDPLCTEKLMPASSG